MSASQLSSHEEIQDGQRAALTSVVSTSSAKEVIVLSVSGVV